MEWNYDPKSNHLVQQLKWVTQSTAKLRQGRIVESANKLYQPISYSEVKKTSLEELILQIKLLQLGDVATFLRELPEPPEERTVHQSLELLG